MFLIKADITFDNTLRKVPIMGQTYRPLLFFSDKIIRSGLIVLEVGEVLEMDQMYENRLIKIYFYKDLDTNKEFFTGRPFTLAEGTSVIGQGVIKEVIGEE